MADGDVTLELVERVWLTFGPDAWHGVPGEEIILALELAQYDLLWRLPKAAVQEHMATDEDALVGSVADLPTDFWQEQLLQVDGHTAARWPISQLGPVGDGTPEDPHFHVWADTDGDVKLIVNVGDPLSALPYALRYLRLPPELSGTSDPILLARYHDLLVLRAVAHLQDCRMEHDRAAVTMNAYIAEVLNVVMRYFVGRHEERGPGGGGAWQVR